MSVVSNSYHMKSPRDSAAFSCSAGAAASRTSVMVRSPCLELERYGSGGDRRPGLLNLLLPGGVEDLLEAAPEHPLAGVRQLALGPKGLVLHDLSPGLVARRLVGPLDKGKGDGLAVLGFHRAIKVGDFPMVDVVRQGFDHPV